jgi:hypothetical protein
MAVNVTTDANTVTVLTTTTNNVNIVDAANNTTVSVSQPTTKVVRISAVGPQGPQGDTFPFTGSAQITGSLGVTGSVGHGLNVQAQGPFSHAEGTLTIAEGYAAHAEGYGTLAQGPYSHAEGESSLALGQGSHAEGYYTIASGPNSHAEGLATVALGSYQHVQGQYNISSSDQSAFIIGNGKSNTTRSNLLFASQSQVQITGSLLTTGSNTFIGNQVITGSLTVTGSVTVRGTVLNGLYSTASGPYSHAEGKYTLASGPYSHTEGGGNYSTIVHSFIDNYNIYGFPIQVSPSTSITVFPQANNIVTITGNYTGSIASYPYTIPTFTLSYYIDEGYTYYTPDFDNLNNLPLPVIASATHNPGTDITTFNLSTPFLDSYYEYTGEIGVTASGTGSHAEGYGTTASGSYSHAEGFNTVALGQYQHVQGQYNIASSAQSAFIIGNGIGTGASRSNLLFASGSQVQITGSLTVSGSSTFTNIGPAIFSGSITSTQGFTGSLQGTVATASYSLTASYVLNGGSETGFPYTGSAEISGSLKVIGKLLHGYAIATTGEASHAEGVSTNASGSYSHAEGSGTVARGLGSHAEGLLTIAEGEGSHAEGNLAKAIGEYSHAEGDNTQAKGGYSHAEGQETISSGSYSHAEGYSTIAQGDRSHAEGWDTVASGSYSHAEGSGTQAIGEASHAEGRDTITLGNYSHAEGAGTQTTGEYSHAEGSITVAVGGWSHAEGLGTVALGDFQHVQGQYNISSSAQSAFIIGNGTADNTRSNLIFASGSQVQVTGSLGVTGSLVMSPSSTFILPLTASTAPAIGSAYWSGSLLFVYNGTRYMSTSFF